MSRTITTVATFLVLLAGSSLLLGQHFSPSAPGGATNQQPAVGEAPDTTTCSFSYSSGSGDVFTRYCLSVNGNVVQFDSPSGYEYIAAGITAEGYGICDNTSNVRYNDYAYTATSNWGASTVTAPNATTRKFVRTTSDGIWQLTQTMKQGKANASGFGNLKITMAVKNLTGASRIMTLVRYADVDANGTTSDQFDFSLNTAFGVEANFGNGLSLTNNTFSISNRAASVWNTFGGPDPCSFNTNRSSGPFVGDGGIGYIYLVAVPAGGTKTINLTYKPI